MAFAIALHNFPEGMVIGASYASDLASGGVGSLAVAIVIGLHNVPEGMSVAVPLAAGGMKKWKATLITAATGVPTILGAMLGYFLGILSPVSLAISLSFASGAMLYVVFGELLPESILMWRSKAPAIAMLAGLLVGVLILFCRTSPDGVFPRRASRKTEHENVAPPSGGAVFFRVFGRISLAVLRYPRQRRMVGCETAHHEQQGRL